MTSYKNVTKYKYTRNPSDVVSLREYILFDDGKEGVRYALLKFVNNLDQKLYALQFEAQQYDESGCLIAKTLVMHDGFIAAAGEKFVPKAKLRLSANCAQISVKIVSAQFDRVRWEKGEFSGNSYSFKRYVAESGKGAQASERVAPAPAAEDAPAAAEKKSKKKQQPTFCSRNIFRQNFAAFPQVFAALAAVLVLAFTVATALWVRKTSDVFSVGNFDVERIEGGNNVRVVGYDGSSKHVTIPAALGDYRVAAVGAGAFKGAKIVSVTFAADDVTVEAKAFERCKSLTAVRGQDSVRVRVLSHAFYNCTEITEIVMTGGAVSRNGFYGSDKVKTLRIDTSASASRDEIFGK